MAHPVTIREARFLASVMNGESWYPTDGELRKRARLFTPSQVQYRLKIALDLGLITKTWGPFRMYQALEAA